MPKSVHAVVSKSKHDEYEAKFKNNNKGSDYSADYSDHKNENRPPRPVSGSGDAKGGGGNKGGSGGNKGYKSGNNKGGGSNKSGGSNKGGGNNKGGGGNKGGGDKSGNGGSYDGASYDNLPEYNPSNNKGSNKNGDKVDPPNRRKFVCSVASCPCGGRYLTFQLLVLTLSNSSNPTASTTWL